jgi:replicative DNA helicase
MGTNDYATKGILETIKPKTMTILPNDKTIEEKVIGAILFTNCFGLTTSLLYEECFYNDQLKDIYITCKELYLQNKPIDLVTVTQEGMKLKKKINPVYLAELTSKVSGNFGIENHCKLLIELNLARETILKADTAIKDVLDRKDIFEVLNTLQSDINAFTHKFINDEPIHIYKLLHDWENKQVTSDGGLTGISTGIKALNAKLGGWQRSDLVILAARPGMGKTSLILHQAVEAAKLGNKVLFFSLEMASEQIIQRMLSLHSGIDLKKIKEKDLDEIEQKSYVDAYTELSQLPIYIDDVAKNNVFKIKSKMQRIKQSVGLDMVFIDYLQIMDVTKSRENRNEELDKLSRELKALAKEFNIPIIALSQLSRSVESRSSKIPMLSDLRESGGIEQNADIVMFIYRPDYYGTFTDAEGNDVRSKAYLIIAKHRNGECGEVMTGWDGSKTKFYDLETSNIMQANVNFDKEPF